MTFFEWAKKHAKNIGKVFNENNFLDYNLNQEMTFPPSSEQVHIIMLINKHIQNS